MAMIDMSDKLAIMPQGDAIITVDGATFTVPAMTPFTSSSQQIDVAAGTVLAIMYNTQSPHGKILQIFSIDEIMTVA